VYLQHSITQVTIGHQDNIRYTSTSSQLTQLIFRILKKLKLNGNAWSLASQSENAFTRACTDKEIENIMALEANTMGGRVGRFITM